MSRPRSLLRLLSFCLALVTGFGAAMFLFSTGFFGETVHVATLADGGNYTGPLREGRLHGQGRIAWPDGASYEGEFREGAFNGRGVYRDGQGNRFEGEFTDGRFTGRGSIQWANGSTYEGEVRDWTMAGEGVYRDGESEYRGHFEAGLLTGKADYYEEGVLVYRGEFRDWVYEGEGEVFADGGRYAGEFEDGLMVDGVFESGDGERYEGGFSYGYYDGKGVLTLPNGDRYEGGFSFGQYDGDGVMHLAQPVEGVSDYSGTWRNGRLVAAQYDFLLEDFRPAMERALYSERRLLTRTLAEVLPGDPDRREIFFLGIAGDGTQRVFRREIEAFGAFLGELEPLQGRQVRLVNDRTLISHRPMATRTSIRKALATLGERMDREQDLLVLYASSHGSADHELSLKNDSIKLADLTAQELAGMLRDSGIRWRMIFVSACYSGGFIEPLKSDYSLVMTSAAADRTSFGCSDDAEKTYFGRALLESLRAGVGVDDVFEHLRAAVDRRESEENLEASNPQLFVGEAMAEKLAAGEFHLF